MKAHARNEGHGKHCQHCVAQPFPGGRIAETVFLPLACKPGNDILKYAERADNGAIDASEQQGQCNKQQYTPAFSASSAGRNCIFAIQPIQPCSVPVKSRNRSVTSAKNTIASVSLIVRNIVIIVLSLQK